MTSLIPGLFAPNTQPVAGTQSGSLKGSVNGLPGSGSYTAKTTVYDGVSFTDVSYTDGTGKSGHYTVMTQRDASGKLESQTAGVDADGRSFWESDSQKVDDSGADHEVTSTFSEGDFSGEDKTWVPQADGSWRFTGAYYTSGGDWGTEVGGYRKADDGSSKFAEIVHSARFNADAVLKLSITLKA